MLRLRVSNLLWIGLIATSMVACSKKGGRNITLDTDDKKVSYAIGQQISRGLKAQGIAADPDVIAMSIDDAINGKEARMTQDQMRKAMTNMRKKLADKRKGEASANKSEGDKFLTKNKSKSGIKTTSSGLQYTILTPGKGRSPTDKDRVKVHYKGTLIDGSEFDSSYKRNRPSEFPVTGVIKGWTEALKMMKPGGKWKLFIPAGLAYGDRARPNIPANSVLIFEVELVEIVAKKGKKAAARKKSKKKS